MKLVSDMLSAFIANDLPQKSDAIILLQGDGYSRVDNASALFKKGFAKKIVITGGVIGNGSFSLPAKVLAKRLYKRGIPKRSVLLEERSKHTYEQGVEMMKLARKEKWRSVILVASLFHQLRAYLTFLQAMKKEGIRIQIWNAPTRGLSWFRKTSLGKNRLQLLEDELKRLFLYRKKGHIVGLDALLRYEQWKDNKRLTL